MALHAAINLGSRDEKFDDLAAGQGGIATRSSPETAGVAGGSWLLHRP